ncbi:MAG: hypothetical protein QNK37_18335 [Acidobacteriota bacterium]|nr:hypothetical protein [Acidobacteriota bacterium]
MIKKAIFTLSLCLSLAFGASQYMMAELPYDCYGDCDEAWNLCMGPCIELERSGQIGAAIMCEYNCNQQHFECELNCPFQ